MEDEPNALEVVQAGLDGAEPGEQDGEKLPGSVEIDLNAEEVKEKIDPKSTAPPEGSKRWKEVYGKMKEFERQLDDAKGSKEQTDLLIQEMRTHNQKLVSSIESMTDVTKEGAEQKAKVDAVGELEGKLKVMKEKRVELMQALDYDAADDLTDAISDIRAELKVARQPKAEVAKQPKVESDALDSVTQSWIDENKWFREDPIMRDAAVTYEEQLSQEFPKASLTEILAKVKEKVGKKFGFVKEGSKTSLVEAGNSNGSKVGKSGTVRLSPAEVLVANGLGVSVEMYAKQKSMYGGK